MCVFPAAAALEWPGLLVDGSQMHIEVALLGEWETTVLADVLLPGPCCSGAMLLHMGVKPGFADVFLPTRGALVLNTGLHMLAQSVAGVAHVSAPAALELWWKVLFPVCVQMAVPHVCLVAHVACVWPCVGVCVEVVVEMLLSGIHLSAALDVADKLHWAWCRVYFHPPCNDDIRMSSSPWCTGLCSSPVISQSLSLITQIVPFASCPLLPKKLLCVSLCMAYRCCSASPAVRMPAWSKASLLISIGVLLSSASSAPLKTNLMGSAHGI